MLSRARKQSSISVGAPLLGNMDGLFFLMALLEEFLLGLLEICKRVFLSIGAPLANLEGFVCADF